jgi:hypothetical protein
MGRSAIFGAPHGATCSAGITGAIELLGAHAVLALPASRNYALLEWARSSGEGKLRCCRKIDKRPADTIDITLRWYPDGGNDNLV